LKVKWLADKPKDYKRLRAVSVSRVLWAYAFGFWSIRALGGSSAVMVLAFVYAHQHPAFVLVYAAAWQLYFF
jgi:hypothetical protein